MGEITKLVANRQSNAHVVTTALQVHARAAAGAIGAALFPQGAPPKGLSVEMFIEALGAALAHHAEAIGAADRALADELDAPAGSLPTSRVDLEIRIEVAADFADLFEVRDEIQKHGTSWRRAGDGEILFGYRRGGFARATRVFTDAPARIADDGFVIGAHIPPHGRWQASLDVLPILGEPTAEEPRLDRSVFTSARRPRAKS